MAIRGFPDLCRSSSAASLSPCPDHCNTEGAPLALFDEVVHGAVWGWWRSSEGFAPPLARKTALASSCSRRIEVDRLQRDLR